jgi:hypothetical protein
LEWTTFSFLYCLNSKPMREDRRRMKGYCRCEEEE